MTVTDARELGLTPAEFHRHLPYALRGYRHWSDTAGAVVAETPLGQRIIIDAADLPPRRLSAVLTLPRCHVLFRFEGFDAAAVQTFMANFDRAFQRGGG